jgi:hypothetical protein
MSKYFKMLLMKMLIWSFRGASWCPWAGSAFEQAWLLCFKLIYGDHTFSALGYCKTWLKLAEMMPQLFDIAKWNHLQAARLHLRAALQCSCEPRARASIEACGSSWKYKIEQMLISFKAHAYLHSYYFNTFLCIHPRGWSSFALDLFIDTQ